MSKQDKNFIQKGFELDKRLNKVAIVAGLGVAAVGSIIAAPAAVAFGAGVAGGSIVGLEVTRRLEQGYEKSRAEKKLGAKATKDNFALAA